MAATLGPVHAESHAGEDLATEDGETLAKI